MNTLTKPKYEITTPYGDRYILNSLGNVLEYSNGFKWQNYNYPTRSLKENLDTWKVLGLVEIKPFNNLGYLIPLKEAVKIKSYSFKNGRPRYTATDLDHGTTRVWGNWNYHGIKNIRVI